MQQPFATQARSDFGCGRFRTLELDGLDSVQGGGGMQVSPPSSHQSKHHDHHQAGKGLGLFEGEARLQSCIT